MDQIMKFLSSLLGVDVTTIIVAIVLIVMGLILFMAIGRVAKFLQMVAPNQALIVYGAGVRSTVEVLRKERDPQTGAAKIARKQVKVSFKIVKGGSVLVWPFLQKIKELDLSLQTLQDVRVEEVRTNDYVPVTVDAVAQIKIGSDDAYIATAAEQHLDKKPQEIWNGASQTLQGHLRAIIGIMKAADITKDREKFSQAVLDVAVDDLAAMGIQIISLVPKEIHDSQKYYESLGKPEIARAQMEARVASATADQEGTQREQQVEKNKAQYLRDTNVAKAGFDKEVFTQQAIAAKAREIAEAEQEKMVEANKAIAAETRATRTEQDLESTVRKPADAEAYRIQKLADANLYQKQKDAAATQATGEGDAAAEKAKGLAKADVEKAALLAEAEGKTKLAEALSSYKPEALQLVLGQALIAQMPSVASAFGDAFANIEQIRLIDIGGGGPAPDGTAGAVQKFLDMVPATVYKFLQGFSAMVGGPVDDLVVALITSQAEKHGVKLTDEQKELIKEKTRAKLEEATKEAPKLEALTPTATVEQPPPAKSEKPKKSDEPPAPPSRRPSRRS